MNWIVPQKFELAALTEEIPSASSVGAKVLKAIAAELDSATVVASVAERFCALYSLVDNFERNAPATNELLVDALCDGLRGVVRAPEAARVERCGAYKKLVFLLQRCVVVAERCERDGGAAEDGETSWALGGSRLEAMRALVAALDSSASAALWEAGMAPDVEIQRLFVEAACAILDSARTMAPRGSRAHAKQRDAALALLGACATIAPPATLELATKLATKLTRFDHASAPIAQICATLGGASSFVDQLVRKCMESVVEAKKDAPLNDRVANFVGALPPIVVVHNVSKFRTLLDAQNYKLRRAFLAAIAEICTAMAAEARALEGGAAEEGQFERFGGSRDAFLDILIDRARCDKNSWVRSDTFKLWRALWDAEAVPASRHCRLLALVGEGLHNKAGAVRTNAARFVCAMIREHPFGDDVKLGGASAAAMRERLAALNAAQRAAATPAKAPRSATPGKEAEVDATEVDATEVDATEEAEAEAEIEVRVGDAAEAALEAAANVAAVTTTEDERVLAFYTTFAAYVVGRSFTSAVSSRAQRSFFPF